MKIALLLALIMVQGCVKTTMEVQSSQYKMCIDSKFCKRLAKVGIDWLTGERTCTCADGTRLRYEEEEVDDDD
jgi:hypothetical protein